jgi:hypothetical protein
MFSCNKTSRFLIAIVTLLVTHCGIGTSIILLMKELKEEKTEKKNNISLQNLSTECVDDIENSLYFLIGVIAFWSIYTRLEKFNIFSADVWVEPTFIKNIRVESRSRFRITFFDLFFWITFVSLLISYSVSYFYPPKNTSNGIIRSINGVLLITTLLAIYAFNALYFICCKKFTKSFAELNLTIDRMKDEKIKPDIESLDFIECWYNFYSRKVVNFDYVFNITFAGRIILLFTNIIVTMRKLAIDKQNMGSTILSYIDATLMMSLFYFLIKSGVNVNEESRKTSEQFHKYILSFKLKDRSPDFDRQVNKVLFFH